MKVLIAGLLGRLLKFAVPAWRRVNRDCDPRKWSNDELRKVGEIFRGDVANVAGGVDQDKEGGYYIDYFKNASSYSIVNYEKQYSLGGTDDKLYCDLSKEIPYNSPLINKFDVVFTHTVLEHVFEIETAVKNLCLISKDIIITIVPFVQAYHHLSRYYHDYWRFTPYTLNKLFSNNGKKTIYVNWNDDPLGNIYLFHIACSDSEKWQHIFQLNQINKERKGPGFYRQALLSNLKSNEVPQCLIKIEDVLGD